MFTVMNKEQKFIGDFSFTDVEVHLKCQEAVTPWCRLPKICVAGFYRDKGSGLCVRCVREYVVLACEGFPLLQMGGSPGVIFPQLLARVCAGGHLHADVLARVLEGGGGHRGGGGAQVASWPPGQAGRV